MRTLARGKSPKETIHHNDARHHPLDVAGQTTICNGCGHEVIIEDQDIRPHREWPWWKRFFFVPTVRIHVYTCEDGQTSTVTRADCPNCGRSSSMYEFFIRTVDGSVANKHPSLYRRYRRLRE